MGNLIKMRINDFLDELASDSPAPGGGTVAALSGAVGASLVSMVCNLTRGKEKYKDVQEEIKKVLRRSEQLRKQLMELVDMDTMAFNEVMKALKMPRENDVEKEKRKQALQNAFKKAASVPLDTARKCIEVLDTALVVAEKGNQNSITDSAVSALMADAGVRSAILNVKINLSSIKDQSFVEKTLQEIQELEKTADEKTRSVLKIVNRKI
ncbi:MAG: methenyltetrahydrofolate cyclohydrolase [Thermoplasmata archaeon]|nr:MAG: methenyltetrahydrofolate cyclohydrolase [Thermoplasmata archaeon]